MVENTTQTKVSFKDDIVPIFYFYRNQMIWRFDLTKYEDVKTNYDQIKNKIDTNQMPPLPYDPLKQEDKDLFKKWGDDGFQP